MASLAAMPDEQLVKLCAHANEDALGELYDRFGSVAFGLAARVLGDRKLAEDAVQNAFLDVWRLARRFDAARASASTWLMVLVHRRAVDAVRVEERHRRRPAPVLHTECASAEQEAMLRFSRERVRSALDTLKPEERRPIELAYYGGLTQAEIATELEIPLGTVKSRMFSGLARLRVELDELAA